MAVIGREEGYGQSHYDLPDSEGSGGYPITVIPLALAKIQPQIHQTIRQNQLLPEVLLRGWCETMELIR